MRLLLIALFDRRARWVTPLVWAAAIACSGEPFVSGEGPTIFMTPPSATVSVGDSTRFVVTLGLKNKRVVWVTSAEAIATVDSMGLVRAKSVGSAAIIATSVVDVNAKTAALVTITAAP